LASTSLTARFGMYH